MGAHSSHSEDSPEIPKNKYRIQGSRGRSGLYQVIFSVEQTPLMLTCERHLDGMDDPEIEVYKNEVRAELRTEARALTSLIPRGYKGKSTRSSPSNAMKDAMRYIR